VDSSRAENRPQLRLSGGRQGRLPRSSCTRTRRVFDRKESLVANEQERRGSGTDYKILDSSSELVFNRRVLHSAPSENRLPGYGHDE